MESRPSERERGHLPKLPTSDIIKLCAWFWLVVIIFAFLAGVGVTLAVTMFELGNEFVNWIIDGS